MSVMFENTDDWVKEKIRGISHRSRVTFTAAAAAGILAHMYTLTNKLPNYDELTFGCLLYTSHCGDFAAGRDATEGRVCGGAFAGGQR